jgi:hypothetical protein
VEAILAPSRHELIVALRFPLLLALTSPFFLRYRIFSREKISAIIRDRVDYGPEAWRLSVYITFLIVMAAYPLSLARYGSWLWAEHRGLTICALVGWFSVGAWIVIRHFSAEEQAGDQLRRELDSISRGVRPEPAAGCPKWLAAWGWLNAVALGLILVAIMRVLWELS